MAQANPAPATEQKAEKKAEAKSELEARPVSVPEVHQLLEREQARRAELSYEQKLALEHSQVFTRIPPEKAAELRERLRKEVPRVTPAHAVKIVDLTPTHADDVKAIFLRDRAPVDAGDVDKIIEIVRSYL
ncbi:MAG: RNA polymerase Rpb4 family protein [Thermoplasmatota archaeon]